MATEEDITLKFKGDFKPVRDELGRFVKRSETRVDKLTKSFSTMRLAAASFAGNLASSAVIGGFRALTSAASGLFRVFVTEGVQAAQVQEDAINKINTALALSGKFTEAASKDFQEFASALQQTTRFGDEFILENAAVLQSLGGLEVEGLKRATVAALDFASAIGIDAKAAITLVGKAAAGDVATFTRYGVSVKKGADNAETLENALTALEKKFGGSAAAQVNTFSGAIEQTSNTFGDLQEEVGFTITQSAGFIEIIKVFNQAFLDLQEVVKDNRQAIRLFLIDGVLSLLNGFKEVIVFGATVIKTFRDIEDSTLDLRIAFKELDVATEETNTSITDTLNVFGLLDDNLKGNQALLEQRKKELKELNDAQDENAESNAELSAFVEKSSLVIENFRMKVIAAKNAQVDQTSAIEALNKKSLEGAAATNELTTAQKKLQKEAKKVLDTVAQSQLGTKLEQELLKVQSALNAQLIAREDFEAQITELELRVTEEREAKRLERLDKDIADLQERNTLLAEIDALANAERIAENQANIDMLLIGEEEGSKLRLKIQADRAKKSKALQQSADAQALSDQNTFLNTTSTLANSESKVLAAAGKTSAVTQIAIATPPAVAGSFRFGAQIGGPPLGFTFAAIAGIAMAAQAAKVAGIPLEHGGQIPPGFPNDSFNARLTSGERVLSVEQNQQFNGLNEGVAQTNMLLGALIGRIDNLENQTVVNIGGNEIINEINAAQREGRVLEAG